MAFENNLPIGSVPLSNQLYKDLDGRIWTGNEFAGQFYRFFDPVDMPHINVKDFGAKGDGSTDDTASWEAALSVAKAMGMALYFPIGQYPITVTDDSIDMNGCTGLTGTGELAMTSTGNPDRPLFKWLGQKSLIESEIEIKKGQNTFTISSGLTLKKGDTVFCVSNERISSDATTYYVKGNRFTVDDYDSDTGDLKTYEPSYYDITSAYLYHNTVRPRVFINGVKITLAGNGDKKGVEVNLGEVFVNNASIVGFGRFGICVSSSLGRLSDTVVNAFYITGTTTGYGIQSAGLTDLIIQGCNSFGARHGVIAGDIGYWKTTDVGEGVEESMFTPSICKVSGSRIEGRNYALDSHLGTTLLEVYNSDIMGGCQLGGLESYVINCRVYQNPDQLAAFWLGRDRPNTNGAAFEGRYVVRGCDIHVSSSLVYVFNNSKHIELRNINVIPTASASARNFLSYQGVAEVEYYEIDGINHSGNSGDNVTYSMQVSVECRLSDIRLVNAGLSVSVRRNTVGNVRVENCKISNPVGNGIIIGALVAANRTFNITLANVDITGSVTGLRVTRARAANIVGGSMIGNTTSVVYQSNSTGNLTSNLTSVYIDQASGDTITIENSQVVSLTLIGNTFAQSGSVGVPATQVVGKYGNVGLNDKLKTSLTNSTTTKYGADSTTGDLTLS